MSFLNKPLYDALRKANVDEQTAEEAAKSTNSIDRLEEMNRSLEREVTTLKWIVGLSLAIILSALVTLVRMNIDIIAKMP